MSRHRWNLAIHSRRASRLHGAQSSEDHAGPQPQAIRPVATTFRVPRYHASRSTLTLQISSMPGFRWTRKASDARKKLWQALSYICKDSTTATSVTSYELSIGFTGCRWTTGHDAEEASLCDDEVFRRRSADRFWQVKLGGPGDARDDFWGPVRGPGEVMDGSDAFP